MMGGMTLLTLLMTIQFMSEENTNRYMCASNSKYETPESNRTVAINQDRMLKHYQVLL